MDTQGLFKYQAKHVFIENCLGSYCIPAIIQTLAIKQTKTLPWQVMCLLYVPVISSAGRN